jgi:hypothetical protein
MENVIIYKRISVSNTKAITSALRDGFLILMPNTLNGDAKARPVHERPRIGKQKRRAKRGKGPAPTEAKRLRDIEIVQLKSKGWSPTAIGRRYGLSCARVCQILATKSVQAKVKPK